MGRFICGVFHVLYHCMLYLLCDTNYTSHVRDVSSDRRFMRGTVHVWDVSCVGQFM